jgi:hypothetical protein
MRRFIPLCEVEDEALDIGRSIHGAQACAAESERLRYKAGYALLKLQRRIEERGLDWWTWAGDTNGLTQHSREFLERLMRLASENQ